MNLITGATGIIGSHVALKLLLAGKPVVACKTKTSDTLKTQKLFSYYAPNYKQLFDQITWVEADVLDIYSIEEALHGISRVYHCAGYVSFDKRNRQKLFKINEGGTANVVNACLEKNVVLCHVSSIVTINNLDYRESLDESVFWKTSGRESDYAISKYNAEREVWRGIEEGLKAVIVNPGVVLSPGFWEQSSARIFSTCYKGNMFYTLGNVGLVSASDVAEAMIRLTEGQHYANRYILVEKNYTFRQLFNMVQEGFGVKKPSVNASRFILQIGRIADGIISKLQNREPALTQSIINSAMNKQQLSNQKIKKALGFDFEPADPLIKKICDFYRNDLKKSALTD